MEVTSAYRGVKLPIWRLRKCQSFPEVLFFNRLRCTWRRGYSRSSTPSSAPSVSSLVNVCFETNTHSQLYVVFSAR
jgi:hypothetical protein